MKEPLIRRNGLNQSSWEDALDTVASQMKSYPSQEIGIVVSGDYTNQEYETLKRFAEAMGVENIGCHAGSVYPSELETTTLDDVENSEFILIIGDVLREYPLLGRRIILAKENGAEICTVDTPDKTLTGINSHRYLQVESTSTIIDEINHNILKKLNPNSTVIINNLKSEKDFEKILNFFGQSGAKMFPVFQDCNSRGAMNILPVLSEDDLRDLMEKVKILYVIGDDLASYMEESLKKLDFIISQGCLVNETTLISDVVLPGSCWAEKTGSFTNTTGKMQNISKITEPPGDALDDQIIITKIAEKMGLPKPEIIFNGYRSSDPERRILNTEKIRTRTDWTPI
ncbi:MAG TPA: molybdopterin-dependent oxidoreductase, partial [Methanobacteriaceae archaeon]|nr:molybdopterin-dependent oxidoreductase [Methanobacteriaceae archaeon]